MVVYGPLGNTVKIRDEQRNLMIKKAKQIHDRLQAKVRELEAQATDELLSVLDADQKSNYLKSTILLERIVLQI